MQQPSSRSQLEEELANNLTRKDKELTSKDEELTSKDEELARKDEELARKDEELARKDEELNKKKQLPKLPPPPITGTGMIRL